MPGIKINVGDPGTKKTYTFEVSEEDASQLHGVKLGDTIKGEIIGKAGYELLITGGSDNAGFPMRKDVQGTAHQKLLITKSVGNQAGRKGMRIRKTLSGNTVSKSTAQLNAKVIKAGKAPLVEVAPAETPAEQKEETQ